MPMEASQRPLLLLAGNQSTHVIVGDLLAPNASAKWPWSQQLAFIWFNGSRSETLLSNIALHAKGSDLLMTLLSGNKS